LDFLGTSFKAAPIVVPFLLVFCPFNFCLFSWAVTRSKVPFLRSGRFFSKLLTSSLSAGLLLLPASFSPHSPTMPACGDRFQTILDRNSSTRPTPSHNPFSPNYYPGFFREPIPHLIPLSFIRILKSFFSPCPWRLREFVSQGFSTCFHHSAVSDFLPHHLLPKISPFNPHSRLFA